VLWNERLLVVSLKNDDLPTYYGPELKKYTSFQNFALEFVQLLMF